jgi:hypothetical protein
MFKNIEVSAVTIEIIPAKVQMGKTCVGLKIIEQIIKSVDCNLVRGEVQFGEKFAAIEDGFVKDFDSLVTKLIAHKIKFFESSIAKVFLKDLCAFQLDIIERNVQN